MSDDYQYQIDIRFAVFIIWALLFIIFIIFPISIIYLDQVMHKFCRGCCSCCPRPAEDDASDSSRVRGTYYAFLPNAQKMEIKRLRMELIKRCLQRYSVWMMIGKDTVMIESEEVNKDLEASEYCTSTEGNVIEKVTESTNIQATEVETRFEDEENAQFSHISIPYPGYDLDGFHASAISSTGKNEVDRPKGKRRLEFIRDLWSNNKKKDKTDPEPLQQPDDVVVQFGEKRTASKFCAICLASYESFDRISWSSNEGCTHVFHNECILTWLSTLGDKSARQQRFTEELEPIELLRYELECPCCRQDFVSRDVIFACCDEEKSVVNDVERPVASEHSV